MKPIRVALSGSGFKFPAHIGALAAIRDLGYSPIQYAGASGGSLIAAMAACGMPVDAMLKLALERDWSDMITWTPLSLLTKMGWCNGNNLKNFVAAETNDMAFSDLHVDLKVLASDLAGARKFVFSKDTTPNAKISLACRASAAIPYVYTPVEYEGGYFLDAGILDNMPIDELDVDEAPRVGIHLISTMNPIRPGTHLTPFTVLPRLLQMLMDSSEAANSRFGMDHGATMVKVETNFVDGLNQKMTPAERQQLYNVGYKSTYGALIGLKNASSAK